MIMRKASIAGVILIIILLGVATFFAVAYVVPIPLGEPDLNVKLAPNPPWNSQTGKPFTLSVVVANKAWLFDSAQNVRVALLAPQNFMINGERTNEYNLTINTLRGGETRDSTLNLTAPYIVLQKNYNVTIKVTADNAAEQSLTVPLKVNSTGFIP